MTKKVQEKVEALDLVGVDALSTLRNLLDELVGCCGKCGTWVKRATAFLENSSLALRLRADDVDMSGELFE